MGFILIPLYTSYISISEYGVLGLVEPLSMLFSTALGFGLNAAFLRWYSVENDTKQKKIIFFNITFFLQANTLLFVLILFTFSKQISTLLFHSAQYTNILRLAFCNVFFLVVNPIVFSSLRVQRKAGRYSFVRVGQFTVTLILNIYLIAYLKIGLIAIFISQLSSSALTFLFFLPSYIKLSFPKIKLLLLKELIKFGMPLILVGVSNTVILMINRYILEYYDNLTSVGIFTFAYRLSNTIKALVIESLALSLTPLIFQKLAKKTENRFVQKIYIYTIFVIIIIYLFTAAFNREFIYIFAQSEKYFDAYLLIPIIAFSYVFYSMNYFYTALLNFQKQTVLLLKGTVLTAFISIALNFMLIPFLKAYGAGFANVLSGLTLFFLLKYYSKNKYPNFFDNYKITLMIIIGCFISIVNYFIFYEISITNFIIKFSLVVSFPFLLYFFKFYEKIELEKMKEISRKILKLIFVRNNQKKRLP